MHPLFIHFLLSNVHIYILLYSVEKQIIEHTNNYSLLIKYTILYIHTLQINQSLINYNNFMYTVYLIIYKIVNLLQKRVSD